MSSHLVTKLHRAALIGLDLRQMEGDVSFQLLEESYPIANQDRQDRITNFVGEPETKAFAGSYTASKNSTVSRVRGRSRLVRTKVGLSPYAQPNLLASKLNAVS